MTSLPLTAIESAHGAYDGFVVDISELEKSHSVVYSLSFNTPRFYSNSSIHYTHLENMSYPVDQAVPHSGPLRFVTDTDDHDIFVYDILLGFKPTPSWLIEAGYENYRYPDAYKQKLPTAAIEQRINLRSELEVQGYGFIIDGYRVGARNIDKYYQFPDHYNVSDCLLGVADQKGQVAPAYWQWNASLSKKLKKLEATIGVQDIFSYTQTKEGDGPADVASSWKSHTSGQSTRLGSKSRQRIHCKTGL